ncbi:MAG: DNA-directed RNA polymerase subunit beta [Gorillibacterium sp.]|nr:DNA-directed RNA polymerase subunit beta [Gorillibacterium sp.]
MNDKRQQPAVRRPSEPIKQPKPKETGGDGGNGGADSKPPRPKRKFHFISKLIVLFLCVVALVCGMALGYAYFGDQPLSDVWKRETWKHVFDLIYAP